MTDDAYAGLCWRCGETPEDCTCDDAPDVIGGEDGEASP